MNTPLRIEEAKWIESGLIGSPFAGTPAPLFQKTFLLEQDVPDAVIQWTCLGLAEMKLDGRILHEGVFLPGWTDYHKRLRVLETHTGPLKAGEHTFEAVVGDGWAVGHIANMPRQFYSDRVRFLARMDWEGEYWITDESWTTSPSEIVRNDLLMGEHVDARLRNIRASHQPAVLSEFDPPPLTLHRDPQVKRQETFAVKELHSRRSITVYDLGQNISGRMHIRVQGDAGATVILRHAEVLTDKGDLYLDNLRGAEATDKYTLSGQGKESWEPSFTFHGFRYVSVEIKGTAEILELTGIALYSDMKRTGDFSCSNSLLNQLFHNIVWGQNGNFLEVPTDCPQRDERLGWTGDAQVFAPTAAFIRDAGPFFKKWLQDLRESQRPDGGIPCFAPEVYAFNIRQYGGPAWADAMILIPWYLYQATGDQTFLSDNYAAMTRYMEFLKKETVLNGICCHPDKTDWGGFGDWLALDGSSTENGNTPKDLIGTAFYARDAELLAGMAEILKRPEDAVNWKTLHSEVRNAFQHRFLTPEGLPVGGTQTGCVLALHFQLVSAEQHSGCVRELVRLVHKNGPKIGTGFVGTPYLLQVLEENGHLDLAYQLLEWTEFPSWLFPVTQGATTIWERWDGIHPERGFQNANMNSFNHYAYGAVGEWIVRNVAGLAPEEPGYRVIRFQPRPGGSLTHAEASLETRYGRASISWEIGAEGLKLELEVPEGCSAILDLHGVAAETIGPGRHVIHH